MPKKMQPAHWQQCHEFEKKIAPILLKTIDAFAWPRRLEANFYYIHGDVYMASLGDDKEITAKCHVK